jgi:hypothetical protein
VDEARRRIIEAMELFTDNPRAAKIVGSRRRLQKLFATLPLAKNNELTGIRLPTIC